MSIVAASYALSQVPAAVDDNKPAPRAQHPVILMNFSSGGGKAERFGLADLCRERRIEPVILNPGDDLRQRVEDTVSRGADLLGIAGGDGSLALVASIASRHDIPSSSLPKLRFPLRAAAGVVAFSRVYTGVDYPSDVLIGATVGTLLGRMTSTIARRWRG